MTPNSKNKRRQSRRRMLPFLALGLAAAHIVLFLLLAQCSALAPGYKSETYYIPIQIEKKREATFQLETPPQRMFYQYASVPLVEKEFEPLPLTLPHWDGYQTLVALKADDYTPITNYRLTMKFQPKAERPRQVHYHYQDIFRPIFIGGTPVQPASRVPEPSSFVLLSFASLFLVRRRRRS